MPVSASARDGGDDEHEPECDRAPGMRGTPAADRGDPVALKAAVL